MQFFGMGMWEIMVIMVIALVIFGPGRLPELAGQVGRAVRDFRSATKDLTGEFERTMNEMESVAGEVKESAMEVRDTARSVTKLDQATTSATKPAQRAAVENPAPGTVPPRTFDPGDGAVAEPVAPRMPTKADPLADLMAVEPVTTGGANGHSRDQTS